MLEPQDELVATHELLARGYGRAAIASAVAAGSLWRVRKGWYVRPGTHARLIRAARVGGRLACVSAAAWYGWWEPPGVDDLHVAVRPQACQLRSSVDSLRRLDGGVHVHWTDSGEGGRLVVPRADALEQVALCIRRDWAFAIWESALARRAVSGNAVRRILARLPTATRTALAVSGTTSGSGTESLVAFGMRRAGIAFVQQVQLGPHRVDFLVGAALVIEVDSREFHDTTSNALRDADLVLAGYRVLRFVYSQVVTDWPAVERVIRAAISRGDHLR